MQAFPAELYFENSLPHTSEIYFSGSQGSFSDSRQKGNAKFAALIFSRSERFVRMSSPGKHNLVFEGRGSGVASLSPRANGNSMRGAGVCCSSRLSTRPFENSNAKKVLAPVSSAINETGYAGSARRDSSSKVVKAFE